MNNKRKKRNWMILSMLMLVLCTNQLYSGEITIRPYGGLGHTMMSEIDLVNTPSRDSKSYRFGLQGLYGINEHLSVGLDIGYQHHYWMSVSNSPDINVRSLTPRLLAQFQMSHFFFQLGLGANIAMGDNTDVFESAMVAAGIDIPINSYLALPIMARMDISTVRFDLPGYGVVEQGIAPVSIMMGLTIKL
ncbi:MAG: porin family protein [Spirochaetota bacterium]|nr:porin family protein [Spirochaetota bacterium]